MRLEDHDRGSPVTWQCDMYMQYCRNSLQTTTRNWGSQPDWLRAIQQLAWAAHKILPECDQSQTTSSRNLLKQSCDRFETNPLWDVLFLQWADTGLLSSPHTAPLSERGWTPSWSCSSLSRARKKNTRWLRLQSRWFSAPISQEWLYTAVPGHFTSIK